MLKHDLGSPALEEPHACVAELKARGRYLLRESCCATAVPEGFTRCSLSLNRLATLAHSPDLSEVCVGAAERDVVLHVSLPGDYPGGAPPAAWLEGLPRHLDASAVLEVALAAAFDGQECLLTLVQEVAADQW